jgi:iron complex transport system ATP-binding protein
MMTGDQEKSKTLPGGKDCSVLPDTRDTGLLLDVKNLEVRLGGRTIVGGASLTVMPGHWLMVAGPNGAGKSTLINAVTQGLPYTGTVLFDGKDISHYRAAELARNIGVLTQSHNVHYDFTVEEVVRLGRYAYSPGIFSRGNDGDESAVRSALEKTGLTEIRKQSVTTLSGGERQRTFLAQVFAQDPRLLILDEPTNHLDPVYQKQIFGMIRDWITDSGKAVISVVHDLSLAKMFGTDALLMQQGRPSESGPIDTILTRESLEKVYSMDMYGWMNGLLAQWER